VAVCGKRAQQLRHRVPIGRLTASLCGNSNSRFVTCIYAKLPAAGMIHKSLYYLDMALLVTRVGGERRYRTGREFEYVWHYMFGEPPSIDPVRECDLLHCTEEELAASEAQLKAIPKYQSLDPTSPQLGVPQSIALARDQNRPERP
jgi:hypothetical protein